MEVRIRGQAGSTLQGSQDGCCLCLTCLPNALHSSVLSTARPQTANSLSSWVLISREQPVLYSPWPLWAQSPLGASSLDQACYHAEPQPASPSPWQEMGLHEDVNQLEKVNLQVKCLQGTTTCYHGAAPNPHLSPDCIPRQE